MILVTGGAGFIGSHLCRRLLDEGYDVISLDDYSTGSTENHHPGALYRRGHTIEIASLVPERPDVIFHLGEYSRVESSFDDVRDVIKSNDRGTRAVLDYWTDGASKIVYAASSTKFAVDPAHSPYADIKRRNARMVADGALAGQPASITYFYNVYGPGERDAAHSGTVIETFRRQHLAGEPLTVVMPGTQRRNFTHVNDIVDGLMIAMEHDGEFPIGAAESYSVLDVAGMFGGPITMLRARKGNRMDSTIDTSRIQALGWIQKHFLTDYIEEIKADEAWLY